MTFSSLGLKSRFWHRLGSYPVWVRPLLVPLAMLFLLLWPFSAILSMLSVILNAIWLRLRRHPPVSQIAAVFDPEVWRDPQREIPHPYDILGRSRLTRRVLAPILLLAWTCLIVAGVSGGLLCLLSNPPGFLESSWVIAFMALAAAGLPAWALGSYHDDLVKHWKGLDCPLCPRCGYNRYGSPGPQCSECGSLAPPVTSGAIPAEWKRWKPVINQRAVFLPFGLFGTVGPLFGLASNWVPLWIIGSGLLALSVSVTAVAGFAALQVLRAGQ